MLFGSFFTVLAFCRQMVQVGVQEKPIVSLDSCDLSFEHLENPSNKPIRIISHWPIRIVSQTNQSRETTITYQKLHASIISSRFGLFQINLNFFHNAPFLSHNVLALKLLFILFYFFFFTLRRKRCLLFRACFRFYKIDGRE